MNPTDKLIKRAENLITSIEHGDQEHREWLRKTFTPIFQAALIETRNEARRDALEEAANIVEDRASILSCTKDAHGLPEAIRSLIVPKGDV